MLIAILSCATKDCIWLQPQGVIEQRASVIDLLNQIKKRKKIANGNFAVLVCYCNMGDEHTWSRGPLHR